MPQNLEFKAYCDDLNNAKDRCRRLFDFIRAGTQEDTYFAVRGGRLKLRVNEEGALALIYYRRQNSPMLRESIFHLVTLAGNASEMAALLEAAIGLRVVVRKRRESYADERNLIHLDEVAGLGTFIEVEVEVRGDDRTQPRARGEELRSLLGINDADIVPWSYAEYALMQRAATDWRTRLHATSHAGTLFLIDGASGVGKTTLASRLMSTRDASLRFVPRYCTRTPRPHPNGEEEYVFVTRDAFDDMAAEGRFLEFRDFEFGMSYGLAWEDTMGPLIDGKDALGIMNLGNVRHVKQLLPEAVVILVVSSPETIARRLKKRGHNAPHEIAERLVNAERVAALERYYDCVVVNEDGALDGAEAACRDIIRSRSITARS